MDFDGTAYSRPYDGPMGIFDGYGESDKLDIRCATCTAPEGNCVCCEKCGKEQPFGQPLAGTPCACLCPTGKHPIWYMSCYCCAHSEDGVGCHKCAKEHEDKIESCAKRPGGHNWVDESRAGPESGSMAGFCKDCGYSFNHILY